MQDKFSTSSGYKMMSEMISKGNLPTAIFAALMFSASQMSVKVLSRLSGNIVPSSSCSMPPIKPTVSEYTNTPLNTVNAPVYAMGIYGIRFILNMMKSKSTDYYSPMRVYLPCPIKVRKSSGIL